MEVTGGMGFFSFISYIRKFFLFVFSFRLKRVMLLAFLLRLFFYTCAFSLSDVSFEGARSFGISLFISTLKKLYFYNTMRV
jgi:hypothetical protein